MAWQTYNKCLCQFCNTCATNGVVMAPSLAAAVQNPIAAPLTLVGYTSAECRDCHTCWHFGLTIAIEATKLRVHPWNTYPMPFFVCYQIDSAHTCVFMYLSC